MARQVAEPAFTVVSRHERFEIRLYASYVVAETRVAGEYWPSLNEGFRRLAGYIFGGNRSQAKIAMTAPVSAQPGSEKLPMTAPVSAQAEAGMRAWLADNPQDKFGRHEYKLAQYGLSPSKVEALLERYLSRYEVEREG